MKWAEVDALLEEALALGDAERRSFLEAACSGDEGVRSQLERLLAAAESDSEKLAPMIDGAVWNDLLRELSEEGGADHGLRPQPATKVDLPSGTAVGPFRIVGPVGAGAMGQVFRAEDTRLERPVALKALASDTEGSARSFELFAREARAASALNHPNIVTIYDIGVEGGFAYLAMEYLGGRTLRGLLAEGRLPLAEGVGLGEQIARGLAAAHAAGIVHRDLKPSNIMVNDEGVAKIVDFGLAKPMRSQLLGDGGTETPSTGGGTLSGAIVGSAGYMAPEQVEGKTADYRADQFSFGALLYEMLTGTRPFARETLIETLRATLRDDPEPLVRLCPQAPLPLQWIVERCLAKRPTERYESTGELLNDLETVGKQLARAPVLQSSPNRILPAERTSLVGRETEVREVSELILKDESRLITLTGAGGTGKTRVALRVAADLREPFGGEVFFVRLESISDADLVLPSILARMGLRPSADRSSASDLIDHLSRPSSPATLLVLDSFEHVLDAASSIARLLDKAPSLKVLVTSREVLRIYGEREYSLSPLELPPAEPVSPEQLAQHSAVALFLERATAIRHDFELTADNAAQVAAICRRLDGLPLAIELAAARLKLLDPAHIHHRLGARLDFLIDGTHDMPERHQTLRGAIDWSYALLNDEEQRLFRRLTVFVDGCTLDAVEAICNPKLDLGIDVVRGVESLLDKSLVRRVGRSEEPRIEMLATLREYGLERLRKSGDEPLTLKAHAAYFMIFAGEGDLALQKPGQTAWLTRFDREHGNLRAAIDWLIREANTEWALQLGSSLWHFWAAREHLAEGRGYLERILELPDSNGPTEKRVAALVAIASLAREQGDFGAAAAYGLEQVEVTRALDDRVGESIALRCVALNLLDQGFAGARGHAERALELAEEVGDPGAKAGALTNLARVLASDGAPEPAMKVLGRAIGIFRQLGDWLSVAWMTSLEGDLALQVSDLAGARGRFEKALAVFRQLDEARGVADCLRALGTVARLEGRADSAAELYAESAKLFHSLGYRRGLSRVLLGRACLAADSDEPARALRLAGAAAALQHRLESSLRSTDSEALDVALEKCRQALGVAANEEWMAGWGLQLDEIVEETLAV